MNVKSFRHLFAPLFFLCSVSLLVACEDSDDNKVDVAVPTDLRVDTVATQDQKTDPDASVDKGTTIDQRNQWDRSGPPTLSNKHTGWQKTSCSGTACHLLPPSTPPNEHMTSVMPNCATCHGGNGACNPNGANSSFTTHNKTPNCTSGCHSAKHGYSNGSDCVTCHFAAAGVIDCP